MTAKWALQAKALAISTALTGVIGAAALAGLKYGGLGAKDIADVASWRGAMQAGEYHRVRPVLPYQATWHLCQAISEFSNMSTDLQGGEVL